MIPDSVEASRTTAPPVDLTVAARYLFGAPGAGLAIEGEVLLRASQGLEAFPGYSFGRHDMPFSAQMTSLEGGETDEAGNAVGEVREAADPDAKVAELMSDYREKFFNPYRAADLGQVDEVIEPRETRPRLIRALEVLRTKVQQSPPKKHGLPPG